MRTQIAVSHPTRTDRHLRPARRCKPRCWRCRPSGQERPAEREHEGEDEGHLKGAHQGADIVHRRTINTMPMTTSNAERALRTVGGDNTD